MQIHFQGRFISRWNDDIFNHMLILVSDNLSSPLTQSFQIYFRILTKLSPHVYFLLSIKKVLMRMQQKQVTKKAAVARKVKGRRGVTILTLLCWLSEIIKSNQWMRWPINGKYKWDKTALRWDFSSTFDDGKSGSSSCQEMEGVTPI